MKNKKILILVNHDLVIYNFRKELVEKLISEGFEVYVSSPNGKRIPELVDMGCKFIETNVNRHGKRPLEEIKLIRFYKKIMKEIQPLCVLTYTIKPNIYGAIAAKKYNIPCIANITGLGTAVEYKSITQALTVNLYKYAFRDIHTVFFQNQDNMNFFIDNSISNSKRYELLPGSGVNLEEFSLLEYPKSDVIKFVFISRIMKEKGIDLYLEAAKIIKASHPKTEFHICGFCEDDYEEKLSEFEKLGYIKYHGMVTNIKEVLEYIHCTVHPSYYPEGISNVLLESSASGRPIITTDRSGCREVINNELNGYLVPEKNTKKLIEAIENFIKLDQRKRIKMGLEGRKFVEKNYNREIIVNTYLKKIKSIIIENEH
ncbi:glycosyltransferase family 4 protein [Vagococcus lutrae]|uniref:glycosyltransferase family 4 protein n=1 Tax=Vagococcus lutrae TaxID=81947 RepID=UPI00289157C3|nr:glycosyltransferase family 4 protein [Vagococcus lutrae]MDT2811546.1 glycosyltransferase family 4 protein [Vagococcus lutrae]